MRNPRESETGEYGRIAFAIAGVAVPMSSIPSMAVAEDAVINVLIVDDEPRNLTVLEAVLSDPQFRLVRATSADEALLALARNDFSVLILDVWMPGMTGFELARTIRGRKNTATIPIIFLAAYNVEVQRVLEGYDTGAVDFLQKPINPAILRFKVQVFADLHRRTQVLAAEVAERRRMEEQLRELNETLEQRVMERTEALRKQTEELTAANERFDLAVRGTNDAIWAWNIVTSDSFISDRYGELLGYQPGEVLPRFEAWAGRLHPEDSERVNQHLRAHLENRAPFDIECRLRTKDGEFRWFRSRGQAVWDEDGKQQRMAGSLADVTERKNLQQRLQQALQRTDQTLRAVVDAAPLAVVSVDGGGRVTGWNPAAIRIFGYQEVEAMGQEFPIGHAALMRELLASVAAGQTVVAQEYSCSRKDGSVLHASVSIAPLSDDGAGNSGAIALIEDITGRRRAEEDLRTITAALATAREDEDRRIACDLHDDIGQRLAMLAVDAGRAAAQGGTTEALRLFQAKILHIAEGIRLISHRMHPSILDDLGLGDALECLCREFETQEGIPVDFHPERLPGGLRPEVATCLYRIAQECLRNISKHARAGDVTLRLAAEGDAIELSIVDSGAGFNREERKPGLGLHSMEERARHVNGALTIASTPGAGTQVVVRVPLQAGRP